MDENPAGVLPSQTVVALFDDHIDAEHALSALRRIALPASSVSVLAKDKTNKRSDDVPIDVTRTMMDTALSASSSWLVGLATLIIPDAGIFLAAGPLGVALARFQPVTRELEDAEGDESDNRFVEVGSAGRALESFGFPAEEAHYFEQRLAAGSALIAVTCGDEETVDATLRTFADFDAIFLGQAETSDDVIGNTEHWLANLEGTGAAEVIVADVVARLQSARANPEAFADAYSWCGLSVADAEGSRVGEVEDVLVDGSVEAAIRYLIVTHGGVFGIAKRRTAVPSACAKRTEDLVEILGGEAKLSEAPDYDPATPFSRQDELASHNYFGVPCYWSEG